jgi:hypothetical protein
MPHIRVLWSSYFPEVGIAPYAAKAADPLRKRLAMEGYAR